MFENLRRFKIQTLNTWEGGSRNWSKKVAWEVKLHEVGQTSEGCWVDLANVAVGQLRIYHENYSFIHNYPQLN